MSKFFISSFFVVILALGAGLVSFGAQASAPASSSKTIDIGKEKKEEKKEKDGKKEAQSQEDGEIFGGRFEGDPIYVRIKSLILPVINEEGVEQLVTLALDIRVKDAETADTLNKNMPRVIDALLRTLYGGLEDGSLKKGKLVNLGKIKAKAIKAVSEIVNRDKIVDVLIEGITQRML